MKYSQVCLWKRPPGASVCAHPLRGLCFFRFHFPEGANVKSLHVFDATLFNLSDEFREAILVLSSR